MLSLHITNTGEAQCANLFSVRLSDCKHGKLLENRSQELETQPALIPYPQATGLETIPEEHQSYELWDARSSVLMASQRKRLGRIDPTEYDDKDGDGLYELPEL